MVEAGFGHSEEQILVGDGERGRTRRYPDDRRIHFRTRIESGRRNALHDLAFRPVEEIHGESGVVRASDVRRHALGELLLNHHDGGSELVFQKFEYDRSGDAVRKVAHENVELRKRNGDRVAFDQPQPVPVLPPYIFRQYRVQLDAADAVRNPDKSGRENAETGADFENAILPPYSGVPYMAVRHAPIDKKILAFALLRDDSRIRDKPARVHLDTNR